MASPMTTPDNEITIEVVRKEEEAEPREVPVYFKVDGYTTASMLYPKYHKIFNWQDVEGGDCTELLRSLEEISDLVLDNPSCSTHYPDPESGIDISIWVTDPTYEVYLDMAGDMEHVSLFIREWTEEGFTYSPLYTGKICGYDNLDIFKKGEDADYTLPREVILPLNSKQEFKVYLGNTRAIDFELEITIDGGINCKRVWGIADWCTRTMAPKVEVTDNSVNIFIDPIAITKEEILATLQDRGKIDVEKLPPALQSGTCGWTFQGDGVAPLGSLSSDTKLRYAAPWLLYDQTSIPPLTYTIDLAYGNPPTSVAAIELHHACDGSLPCAPIIHASLDELPIVELVVNKPEAKFVVWSDPETGEETVEVHPYIMVVPGEISPVFCAVVNTGNVPIAVDMWEVFGGIELPPHRTPVIPVGETIDFDYMTTRPDLPLGQYKCIFYLGQHDKGIVYDKFTQPAIIIVDHCIIPISTELTTQPIVQPGKVYTGVLCVDVLSIDNADSAFADIWVCKDGDKTWEKMKEADMTIVDRKRWPLMEETRIGLTRTETLYPNKHYCLEFEFTVPTDWTPGTYELDLYFGEWDQYFIYWPDIPDSFTVEVTEEEEVDGTIDIPASTIPTTLYSQTPSAFDMHVINTGTVDAQYQVAITFTGIDTPNDEVFWSGWSADVAPNESTTLPLSVELSEEAVPAGVETAEYNIFTRLVAR